MCNWVGLEHTCIPTDFVQIAPDYEKRPIFHIMCKTKLCLPVPHNIQE